MLYNLIYIEELKNNFNIKNMKLVEFPVCFIEEGSRGEFLIVFDFSDGDE